MAEPPVSDRGPEVQSEVRTEAPDPTVKVLTSYLEEARSARMGGVNPRDAKWDENLDLYWSRFDFHDKADWQSQEATPEVPGFVDRFAAALKEAFGVAADGMYNVVDPSDAQHDLTPPIKRMTDAWLSTSGYNASGQPMSFEGVFEEQMKLGSLMATSALVTWRDDVAHGRVAVETADPRDVWLDHTSRGLYRIRRIELDKHKLQELAELRDSRGERRLYHLDKLEAQAAEFVHDAKAEREGLTGHGQETTSLRQPLVLHEFYGDIVSPDGKPIARNAMTVMSNETHIVRGPEPNPFWHGRDWLVYAPLVTVPLSPYGRGYVEDFGSMARVFNKLTNLILDAVAFSSVRAFAAIPEMLEDPSQLDSGVTMGKVFKLQGGIGPASEFLETIELGSLNADTVKVWEAIKGELTENAKINEVGLGQFAPNSRTSATEITETQQSSSALIRSVAQTVEQRFFEPVVGLVWKTGLQHVSRRDEALRAAAGPEMFDALIGARKELIKRPITFQARGISNLIQKSQKLRSLIQLLQLVAGNEILLQQFLQVVDLAKLVDLLFDLANLDIRRIRATEREAIIRSFAGPLGGGEPSGGGSPPRPAQDVAGMLGVARG